MAVAIGALLMCTQVNAQSFLDNTFVEGAVGANLGPVNPHNLKIALATEVGVGKWFSPVFGTRIGWHGIGAYGQPYNCIKVDIMTDFLKLLSKAQRESNQTRIHPEPFISLGTDIMGDHAGFLFGLGASLGFDLNENLMLFINCGDLFEFNPQKKSAPIPFASYPVLYNCLGIRYTFR